MSTFILYIQFQKFGLLVVSRHDGAEWYTLDYTELMKQVGAWIVANSTGSFQPGCTSSR